MEVNGEKNHGKKEISSSTQTQQEKKTARQQGNGIQNSFELSLLCVFKSNARKPALNSVYSSFHFTFLLCAEWVCWTITKIFIVIVTEFQIAFSLCAFRFFLLIFLQHFVLMIFSVGYFAICLCPVLSFLYFFPVCRRSAVCSFAHLINVKCNDSVSQQK